MSFQRHDKMDFGQSGIVSLIWPDEMTDEELNEFDEWIDLCKKKVRRIAAIKAESDPISEGPSK